MSAPTKIAFIGLGAMGAPMAKRLIASGHDIALFDARTGAAETIDQQRAAKSASAAVEGRDVVITMLPTAAIVAAVLTAEDVRAALAPGAAVIDMSSSEPHATKALGATLAEQDVALIDAPVSGGVARAEKGTLAIMVGGSAEHFARAAPLLQAMGSSVTHVGPLGAGHAVKALNNLMSAGGLLLAAEAFAAGVKFGVDPRTMLAVINGSSGKNNSTEAKFAPFVFSRAFNSGFALDLMVKDLGIALALQESTETPNDLSSTVLGAWRTAQAALGSGCDHTEIVRWVEDRAHVELK